MSQSWNPAIETSEVEERILKLCKKQKLWAFLRRYRHRILDDEIRAELRALYAPSGRGKPVPPEQLALAMLLQVAFGVADHEVPTLTAVDRRWRMMLDCLDNDVDETAFSQGSVYNFRERAREHGLMKRLLDKTVALARETRGFGHKKLRLMIDSSPLLGAGRVEDSFNLIGRAIAGLVEIAAMEAAVDTAELVEELSLSVVSAKSVKSALDIDWRLPTARNEALQTLLEQFERLRSWLTEQFTVEQIAGPPLGEALGLVEHLIEQDTEPDPETPDGARRIRKGGEDRQISISDPDMRHGRKTRTKLFTGYKRHVSFDMDIRGLGHSVHVLPANKPEHDGAAPLLDDAEAEGDEIAELHHDRGYLPAEAIHQRRATGMKIVSKPPTPRRNGDRLSKADFDIDVAAGTVTCPEGVRRDIHEAPSSTYASFSGAQCSNCDIAARCLPDSGRRVITLHAHENLHRKMAAELGTSEGRAARRERVAVEHGLARLGAIQGRRARYRGLEKNQAHAEVCLAVANCHVLDRLFAEAA